MSRYLNVILTVNAVLLAGLVWTQIANQPVLSSEAQAGSPPPRRAIVLDPGAQRAEIIKLLGEMRAELSATRALLENGDAKVTALDPSARVTRNTRRR